MKKVIKLKFDERSIEHLITETHNSFISMALEDSLEASGFFLYESPFSEKTIVSVDSNFECKLSYCNTFLEAKIVAEFLSPDEYAIFGSEYFVEDKCTHEYVVWYPVTE